MLELDPCAERCLRAYEHLLERDGRPPSVRDLAQEYGCASSSTIYAQIEKLRKAGHALPTRGKSGTDGVHMAPRVWRLSHEIDATLRQLDEQKATHLICKLRSVVYEFASAATCTILILLPLLLPGGAL